jgi:hypothetical protein
MTARWLSSNFDLQLREAAMQDPNYQSIQAAKLDPTSKEFSDKAMTADKGPLFVNHRWLVPDNKEIRNIILHAEHDSRVAGQFGQFKTLERLKANFYWPKMELDVEEYVRSCYSFQRNKAARHKKFGLLDPLDIPNRPWDEISMDFIVSLP